MKKIVVILLVLVIIVSMLSFVACNNTSEDNRTKIIIKVPALGMDISAKASGITSVADFLERMATEYMKQNPDIEIEIAEYESAKEEHFVGDLIGTEDAPDILFNSYNNMRSYAYTGSVVPLDDLKRRIDATQKYTFDENAWNASLIEEKAYMLPFYSQQYVFAYNYSRIVRVLKKALDESSDTTLKAAINAFINDTLPNTKEKASSKIINFSDAEWEMLLQVLKEYGYGYNYPMMMYAANTQGDSHILTTLMSYGAQITKNGAVTLNNAQGIAALQQIADYNAAGYYPDKSENFDINDCIDLFLNNQLMFCICNNSLYNQYKESIEFGLVNFKGDVSENFYYGFEVFDNGDSNKVNIAKDFIEFIYLGKIGQIENISYSCCGIPAITEVEMDNTNYITFYSEFSKNLSKCVGSSVDTYAVIGAGITNWNDVRKVIQKEMQELLKGSMTPAEVAAEIDSKCATVISAAKGKLHP